LDEEPEGNNLLGRPRDRWDITQWIANKMGGRVLAGFIWLSESDSGQYVAQIPEPQHMNKKINSQMSLRKKLQQQGLAACCVLLFEMYLKMRCV
jgi:DNA-binding PucR family transcriptional regulator